MILALASDLVPGLFEHVAILITAIVAACAALPIIVAICFALGGLAVTILLVSVIGMIALAIKMVRRKRARRAALDPYAVPFGDYPHAFGFIDPRNADRKAGL